MSVPAFSRLWLNLLLLAAVIGCVYYVAFAVDLAVDADVNAWELPLAALEVATWGVPFVFAIALPSGLVYLLLLAALYRSRLRHQRAAAVVLAPSIVAVAHWNDLGLSWWTVPAFVAATVYGRIVRLRRPE